MKLARRHLITALLAAPLGLALGSKSRSLVAGGGVVYVFVMTKIRPRALQQAMISAMPGINVTVFGRVGDFEDALRSSPPDCALAIAPVLESVGLSPAMRGKLNGSTEEKYSLVSESGMSAATAANRRVGCVDLVGRRRLPGFVGDILGTGGNPKVQRVTKLEDLLLLLQLNRADAIVLPKRLVRVLEGRSKMDLKPVSLSSGVGCTAAAFPGNRGAVEGALRSLPSSVLSELGIDGWK